MTLLFIGLLYSVCVAVCMAYGYAPYVLLHYLGAANPLPPETRLPLQQALLICFYLVLAFGLVILPVKVGKIRQWVFDYVEFPIEARLKTLTPDNPRILTELNNLQTTLAQIGQLDWPYQRYAPSQDIPPYMDIIERIQKGLIRLQHCVRQQPTTGLPDPTVAIQWQSAKAAIDELPTQLGEIMTDRLTYHYSRVAEVLVLVSLPLSIATLGVLGVVLSLGTLVGALVSGLERRSITGERSYRTPRGLGAS
jgi:hypothetical protein